MRKLFFAIIISISFTAYSDITSGILKNYKKNFSKLSPSQQEHFAWRMYAITGDSQYFKPLKHYLELLSNKLNSFIDNCFNEHFREFENSKILKHVPLDTKRKERIAILSKQPDIAFDLRFLDLLYKMHFYSLQKTALIKNPQLGIAYIKSKVPSLSQFILDKNHIKIYGPQLINYVFYLVELDIVDLRKPYTDLFKKTFPDREDKALSNALLSSKVYGLTHFILAASSYYQSYPEPSQFQWIVNYFDKNIDRIILQTENDIIVEVGICYLLLGKTHLGSFEKINRYLIHALANTPPLLPNKELSYDFKGGEHRNILTIMFFKWPKSFNRLPQRFYRSFEKLPPRQYS